MSGIHRNLQRARLYATVFIKTMVFLLLFTITGCHSKQLPDHVEEVTNQNKPTIENILSSSQPEKNNIPIKVEKITVDCDTVQNPEISKLIFGINAASYNVDNLSPEIKKYLSEWCETIRWPSGANTEYYDWYTHMRKNEVISDETLTMNFVDFTKQVGDGAEVLVGVNTSFDLNPESEIINAVKPIYSGVLPSGAAHAADWVKYCNKDFTKAYGKNPQHSESFGIKYWEIGNEANLVLKREVNMPDEEAKKRYAQTFRDYFNAMTAVDPDIKVMGPVSTIAGFDGGSESFMHYFLQQCGDIVDLVSFHWYQRDKYTTLQDTLMFKVDDYADYIRQTREWIDQYCTSTPRRSKEDIKIALTEYNAGPGTVCENAIWDHAIWAADMLGMFMRENVYMAHIWHIYMGTHSMYNLKDNFKPYPAHYAFKFMHTHSHVREGSKLLKGNSSTEFLRVYPIEYGNKISVIVINKSNKDDITANIDISKKVGSMVTVYELAGEGNETSNTSQNGNERYEYTFKKHSITCLDFEYQ